MPIIMPMMTCCTAVMSPGIDIGSITGTSGIVGTMSNVNVMAKTNLIRLGINLEP